MKAMILAAGLGTRLRPLTETCPKALIRVAGRSLLQITLERCSAAGFGEIAVNVHHHAEQIGEFLSTWVPSGGTRVLMSHETELLSTGGGIRRMAGLLHTAEPVLVHNVDVLSDIDLAGLWRDHCASGAAATLAVQSRDSDRSLIFDGRNLLCGHRTGERRNLAYPSPVEPVCERHFCGIQVIDPQMFARHPEEIFSSVDLYLRAAAGGRAIRACIFDGCYCRDLGTLQQLESARDDVEAGRIAL